MTFDQYETRRVELEKMVARSTFYEVDEVQYGRWALAAVHAREKEQCYLLLEALAEEYYGQPDRLEQAVAAYDEGDAYPC